MSALRLWHQGGLLLPVLLKEVVWLSGAAVVTSTRAQVWSTSAAEQTQIKIFRINQVKVK